MLLPKGGSPVLDNMRIFMVTIIKIIKNDQRNAGGTLRQKETKIVPKTAKKKK